MKQPGMIHNVIVTNEHGTILLSTYWDGSSASERGKFEHDLYLQTREEWGEITPSKEDTGKYDTYKTHVSLVEDKCVVYKKTSDVVFFITGSGEYTELILNEVLNVIMNGFLAMCPKKRISAAEFANDNTYGKMVAILDQIVYMGQYCQSDIVIADARAKMKSV
ncbi:hypothetical protein WA588_005721 [Blastocystis sp. NMH]